MNWWASATPSKRSTISKSSVALPSAATSSAMSQRLNGGGGGDGGGRSLGAVQLPSTGARARGGAAPHGQTLSTYGGEQRQRRNQLYGNRMAIRRRLDGNHLSTWTSRARRTFVIGSTRSRTTCSIEESTCGKRRAVLVGA